MTTNSYESSLPIPRLFQHWAISSDYVKTVVQPKMCRDRNTAHSTLGKSLSVSLFPRYHYPGGPHGALTRIYPWGIDLPSFLTRSVHNKIHTTTFVRRLFTRLQIFTNVQVSRFTRHPGHSHGSGGYYKQKHWEAVTFTSTHISVCYLPREVDMLAVRIEQLTVQGLLPSQVHGLAGRS